MKFMVIIIILVFSQLKQSYCYSRPNDIIGQFNKEYENVVNRSTELIYRFDIDALSCFNPGRDKIRVELTTNENVTWKYPLYVSVIQTHEVILLELPFNSDKNNMQKAVNYTYASRTLCNQRRLSNHEEILVRVSTGSPTNVAFNLTMVLQPYHLLLEPDQKYNLRVSPSTPEFFYFEFKNSSTSDRAVVKVQSDNDFCMILAIQHDDCPVRDQQNNVRYQSKWQTVATKGAITVQNTGEEKGFYVKLVVMDDDMACGNFSKRSSTLTPRIKNVQLEIANGIVMSLETWDFVLAILLPPALSLLLVLATAAVYLTSFWFTCKQEVANRAGRAADNIEVFTMQEFSRNCRRSRDEGDHDYDANNKTTRKNKYKFKSMYYLVNIVIISIFFSIPVFQRTIYNIMVVGTTGEEDQCFYNSLCAHPYWYFKDFNHLWSNTPYMVFGAGFIAITFGKRKIERKEVTDYDRREKGIRFHSGLYFALGVALIMTGLMSSAYHFCPNVTSFQYDTFYMYMISVMIILKIVEFRHPRHLSISVSFLILALFSLVSALGLTFETFEWNTAFFILRCVVAVFQISIVARYACYKLYLGVEIEIEEIVRPVTYRKDIPVFLCILPACWKFKGPTEQLMQYRKIMCERLLFVTIVVILNLFLIYQSFSTDYANYILQFLISHLTIYFTYYLLLKWVWGEFAIHYKSLQMFVYLALAFGFGIPAVQYFMHHVTEWSQSPAQSRMSNEDCIWATSYGFYDHHDCWHILSACSLFFVFMTLLSIDDGVDLQDRTSLYVY